MTANTESTVTRLSKHWQCLTSAAGGAGVFFTPDGIIETTFSWGLGTETNNIAEALALWKGLVIAKNKGITRLTVLGDSRIVIQAIVEGTLPNHLHLRQLLTKIQYLVCSFHKSYFFSCA